MSKQLTNPAFYFNRELSWLEFNQRVMEQAVSHDNPVFERMKFISITMNNLDEFFMIRVASLRDQVQAGWREPDASGLTPEQKLSKIVDRTHRMIDHVYSIYHDDIIPELNANLIHILTLDKINDQQKNYLISYYEQEVYPVLTPVASDSSRPFPLLLSKSLNLAILTKGKKGEPVFATVQVPSVLPRLIEIPSDNGAIHFILLEDIIRMNISRLFQGKKVLACAPYRITRNADLSFEEEEAEDLLLEIRKSLQMRKWGSVIRLEISHTMDKRLVQLLKKEFEINQNEVYRIDGPLNLDFLMKQLYPLKRYEHLKYTPYTPAVPTIFCSGLPVVDIIAKGDILLHHPYDSFEPVIRFLEEAASDPTVLAIKQTLYRVSGNSPIVNALAKAAEAGKQVTVLLEVKARFDEENNIQWGDRLEKAGCHVIYGLAGLKTHSKITLVVRREQNEIHRYIHLGTGNYNDVTAKIYTDYSLFTCDKTIGSDASVFFNSLTGLSTPPEMNKLISAPTDLRPFLIQKIEREIQHALRGNPAAIFAKMNSLVDTRLIKKLYKASQAGVKICLIVRGICCLRPGIEGVSDNIEVHSIIGRFLEHSRVYQFYNNAQSELYLSSADMMPRNMDRRVELLFPIENQLIAKRIMSDMGIYWADTVKTSVLYENGDYIKRKMSDHQSLNAQESLIIPSFV